MTSYPNGYGRRERAPEYVELSRDVDCPCCGGSGEHLFGEGMDADKRQQACHGGDKAMKKSRVSRTFRDTAGENRKMEEWARQLEAEGFRSIGMVKLPRRKGENYLHSPIRWKYTFERREDAQTGVTPGSAEEVSE